ncbi:hypothetical protein [Streptomyces sp. G-G2]|uniref:hypothetical protein n=1 Tax=Streptomyces sp. G-G2 TaxID=3046201 RepID=UPI0024BB52AC|nr:hypothetical protein [Streptomyces sp. G-G2]MDJ0380220.1 hypothetical protein [Streptomyces sp. G-G2]
MPRPTPSWRVADRRTLLTTSANFTQAGVDRNIEAGILIGGGPAPLRAVEHVRELQRTGVIRQLWIDAPCGMTHV